MKSLEELRPFYNSELVPKLQKLDIKRKKTAFKVLITLLLISILTGLVFLVTHHPIAMIGGVVVYFIIHFLWFDKKIKEITKEFKFEIIQNLVKFFDTSLSYIPTESIYEAEYFESQLFLTGVDRYSGDDLISGKLDKTSIKFSEVHTEYKTTYTDSNGNTKTTWHTIFRGIFLIADFNKNFNGKTVVLPDSAESLFGSFIGNALQKMDMTRDALVKMEDIEFEKLFCVHSTDPVEARYILSPKLMQRIINFKKKSGKTIHLSFVNSKLFIAISIHKELFEPPLFKTLLNPELIEEFFDYLSLSVSIVEELDLNTRIWTKI